MTPSNTTWIIYARLRDIVLSPLVGKGRDHETAGHRGSRASVEGTSVASSGQNETMGRQTDSHQAQFRGRLFSRPSKQSAAISSGGRRASTVRMYKRSRDGVSEGGNAMPNSVLARSL